MPQFSIYIRYILLALCLISSSAYAILSLELTQGVLGALPIAVVPFSTEDASILQSSTDVIANDLQNSGRFRVIGMKSLTQFPDTAKKVSNPFFRKLGADNVVVGRINKIDSSNYEVKFQLLDMFKQGNNSIILSKTYSVKKDDLRTLSHHISDLIYQQITGVRGVFSTKIAYVVVKRQKVPQYVLEVSDQDGFNPRPLLTSSEPIMSPAWSPDGKKLAYVSFENRRANIYIQSLASGNRELISQFPGINGAPAWSPDGKKLALVLSKSGAPNVYIMDIAKHTVKAVTQDYYINTEPAFTADGQSIIFTSNRSGKPQIYQINLANNQVSRLSFDGDYNARATLARSGRKVAIIHRVSDLYNIAFLDLDTGNMKILNGTARDSASPSIAPNDSMVLYDTYAQGKNVLGIVSVDGRVQITLPARDGDAQDPAWSPFLS